MNKTILVVTVGTTDIKILSHCQLNGKPLRYPLGLPLAAQREFSQLMVEPQLNVDIGGKTPNADFQLLTRLSLADIDQLFDEFKQVERDYWQNSPDAEFGPEAKLYKGENKPKASHKNFTLTTDPMQLVAVKLLPIARLLHSSGSTVSTCIVLNTHRNDSMQGKYIKKEPYAVGELLASWLAEEFDLDDVGKYIQGKTRIQGSAFYCDFLHGEMQAQGERENYPVLREATQIIDDLLQRVADDYADEEVSLFYCPSGGLPAYKSQIEAACQFYFKRVTTWSPPEKADTFNSEDHRENTHLYPAPDVSYRARKQVIEQIENGNFEGAATIASAFYHAGAEQPQQLKADQQWACAVVTVSDWFQGKASLAQLQAQLPEVFSGFKQEKELPNSLWAGFKVEAALRQGNLHDAIRYTCDIRDIALYDMLGKLTAEGDFDFYHAGNKRGDIPSPLNSQLKTLGETFKVQHRKVEDDGTHKIRDYKFNDLVSNDKHRLRLDDQRVTFQPKPEPENHTQPANADKQEKPASANALVLKQIKQASRKSAHWHDLEPLNWRASDRSLLVDLTCLADTNNSYDMCVHPLNRYEATLGLKAEQLGSQLKAKDYRNIITHGYLPPEMAEQAKQHFKHTDIAFWAASPDKQAMRFLEQPLFTQLYARLNAENPAELYKQLVAALKQKLISARIDGQLAGAAN